MEEKERNRKLERERMRECERQRRRQTEREREGEGGREREGGETDRQREIKGTVLNRERGFH